MEASKPHILVACFPAQGHINPSLRLAKFLARETGARVTFSTAVHAHRLMFPSPEADPEPPLADSLFTHIPFSNGYDDGFDPDKHDRTRVIPDTKIHGSASLAAVLDSLSSIGRPVTCLIYSFFMSWCADIATARGIPSFLFWIQPATAFAAYWHYFHGYHGIVSAAADDPSAVVNFPRLPPMKIRDLPSFLVSRRSLDDNVLPHIQEMMESLEMKSGEARPRVIANTARELEAAAMESVAKEVEVLGIGPVLEDAAEGSLFKADDETGACMEWLDGQAGRSVVYVAFGSLPVLSRKQAEEIGRALRASGWAYLWVLTKNSRWEEMELSGGERGKVVEWCAQGRVLGHRAVGCFVTHCGWNSTVDGLLCGVPAVAMPQWSDQPTNAWLMEREWGTGVRAEVGKDGVVEAEELLRCLEAVMGEGEGAVEIRKRAAVWKEKAGRVAGEGGSSHRNLRSFVKEIASS